MKTKKCTKCHTKKGITLFTKDSSKKDEYYSSCKDCYRKRMGATKRRKREKQTIHGIVRWCGRCKKYKLKSTFGSNKYYADNFNVQCKECSIKDTRTEVSKRNHKGRRQEERFIVLRNYSNNKLECNCCGEKIYEFLSLDHTDGGGNKHRKKIGNVFRWIIKNNFPDGFQVLCYNCNLAKGFYGICPHKNEKNI